MKGLPAFGSLSLHQWLLAATVYTAVHQTPEAGWLSIGLTVGNALLWLVWTQRLPETRKAWSVLRGIPLLFVIPTAYLTVVSLVFAVKTGVAPAWIAADTLVYALTFLLAALVFAATSDSRPFFSALSLAGALLCVEGVALMLSRMEDPGWLYSPARFFHRPELRHTELRLGGGLLPWASVMASLMLVFAAVALGLRACAKTGRARLFWSGVFGLNVLSILLTGTRAAVILAGGVLLGHPARKTGAGRRIAGGLAVTGILLIAWMAVLPRSPIRGDGSLRGRMHMWRLSLRLAKENPLFGAGPGAFRAAWPAYGRAHGYSHNFTEPHSLAFSLLVDGGFLLVGMAALLAGSLLWEAWWLWRAALPPTTHEMLFAFALGLLAVLVHDLFEMALRERPLHLLVLILAGLLVGLRGYTVQERGSAT